MSIETYDAEWDHPWATRWRIPRVHSPYPRWKFEVALCVPEPGRPDQLWGATEPSENEALIIAWFIDFRRSYYNERWQQKMLERPFDIDSSTNTVILIRTEGGWQYRRATFETGPWPYWNDERRSEFPPTADGLLSLLDHIEFTSRWPNWKAAHPLPAAEVEK